MKGDKSNMKRMKKLVTLLLSLVMLCALAMPAMAAEPYSITINGAVVGHTYTAYQVFKGVYYKGDRQVAGKDAEYLSDVIWGNGVDGNAILNELKTNETLKSKFKTVNSAEEAAYVLQGMKDRSEELDEFARVVGKHLTGTTAGTTGRVATGAEAKINNLLAGYYFVKDTGTIGDGEIATKFLVKVVGNASVTVKAQAPEFEKKVLNGSADKGTSVNVGDKVTFQLTAKVPDMASFEKYTFTMHDTLSKGLTFNKESVKVTVNGSQIANTTGSSDKYTLAYPTATESSDTFTIAFTETQLKGLVNHTDDTTHFGATIVVEYTATLNENALLKDVETNKAYLEYTNNPGSDSTKNTPETSAYVYDFDIVIDKYDGTNGDTAADKAKKLKGATFILYKVEGSGSTAKKLYYVQDESNKTVTWNETEASATRFTTDENGKTTFQGIAEGTYFLHETQSPDGYNSLKEDPKVEIKATYDSDGKLTSTTATSTGNGQYIQVQSIANKAGAVLPSTGGIGTTIFYVLGSILVLGAAVLLIVKKRMKDQER